MRRGISVSTIITAASILTGCGFADSHAPLPKFMLKNESVPQQLDAQPNVKQLARDKLESIFMAASNPQHVRVSPPRREPNGAGWTSCIKAELISATGRPLGTQTYLMTISDGLIVDRRRAGADDNCESEVYEPL
jgi:hypothetical protein